MTAKTTTRKPSPPEPNGRSGAGRFTSGNTFGRGNPHARRVQELRAAFLNAVTDDDIAEIVAGMISAAKSGDVPAAKLLIDRCLGKIVAADNVPFNSDVDGYLHRFLQQHPDEPKLAKLKADCAAEIGASG